MSKHWMVRGETRLSMASSDVEVRKLRPGSKKREAHRDQEPGCKPKEFTSSKCFSISLWHFLMAFWKTV
jgi:hypothetical protein